MRDSAAAGTAERSRIFDTGDSDLRAVSGTLDQTAVDHACAAAQAFEGNKVHRGSQINSSVGYLAGASSGRSR